MQGITTRSDAIVGQLLAQLPGWLREDIVQLAHGVAGVGLDTDPECCRDSRARLSAGADAFATALVDGLAGGCAEACAATAGEEPARPANGSRELRLLDLDVADEEAALAAIARRMAAGASLPLMLLGQRFGVLFATPPVGPGDMPFGPRAFVDALAAAAGRLALCPHARRALYQRFDLQASGLYPRFAEAIDATLDEAGILRGMSFVPLRRQMHIALTVAEATGRDALQAVGRAADALAPEANLAAGARRGRRDAMSALARYLMRHGRDSNQWRECIEVAGSLQDAAQAQVPAPLEAQAWLRKAFSELGYAEDEAGQLAAGLAPGGEVGPAAASQAPGDDAPAMARGVREQRCFDRLQQLPIGAMLGFSAGRGGFLHARVDSHHAEPPRLLLTCLEGGCEIIFEADLLARMLASGEAWVMRRAVGAEAAQ